MLDQSSHFLTRSAPRWWHAAWCVFALPLLLLQLWYVVWLMTFDLSQLPTSMQHAVLDAVQYMRWQDVVTLTEFWQWPSLAAISQISPWVFWNGFALFSLLLFSAGLWLLQRTLLRIHLDYLPACFFLMGVLHWLAAWLVLQQLSTIALVGALSSLGVMGLGYFIATGVLVLVVTQITASRGADAIVTRSQISTANERA